MVTTQSVLILSRPMSGARVERKWNEKGKLGAWIHSHWKWTNNNKFFPYEWIPSFSNGTVKIQMHTHSGGKGDVVSAENWERKNSQFIKLNQSNFERNGPWSSFFSLFFLFFCCHVRHSSTIATSLIFSRVAVQMLGGRNMKKRPTMDTSWRAYRFIW